MKATMEVIQVSGDVGQEPVGNDVLRSPASSKKERLKVTGTNSQETSQLAGSKRPPSHASGSLRVSKAAKVINAKVEMTQLKEKSKTGERKTAPIKCRSPGINMMARNRSARYPILGTIARDVLAFPASSVASESAFSICGRVVTDHRSSLSAETVEALMCLEDWIRPT